MVKPYLPPPLHTQTALRGLWAYYNLWQRWPTNSHAKLNDNQWNILCYMHKKHNETYSDSILISVMLLSVANTVSPEHNLNTHQFVKIKLHPYRYPIGSVMHIRSQCQRVQGDQMGTKDYVYQSVLFTSKASFSRSMRSSSIPHCNWAHYGQIWWWHLHINE